MLENDVLRPFRVFRARRPRRTGKTSLDNGKTVRPYGVILRIEFCKLVKNAFEPRRSDFGERIVKSLLIEAFLVCEERFILRYNNDELFPAVRSPLKKGAMI